MSIPVTDGYLGYVNEDDTPNRSREDYIAEHKYFVLESNCVTTPVGNMARAFIVEDVNKKERKFIVVELGSVAWGSASTIVAGDRINLKYLIKVQDIQCEIVEIQLIK